MKLTLALVLLLISLNGHAAPELHLPLSSTQVSSSTTLGNIEIEGVGKVSLIASRSGQQLLVYARDPGGKIIGKAETVVGLKDTPIHVLTPGGLTRITIYWDTD